ncbi:DUF2273 domain-containing protein [Paenibacillus sp. DXFW5]|uniref:DUF2273 domain-containing protein n=1 Tax=Paenibacillus rhizolycopersici TaxID=2780073 RepID=A0ABS2H2F5_9BACL|nr:DUF2273 domain-containing protein [Paenibacillus sp. J53TS2]MBM6995605.1 DUF2273 domain-containing protein [Paenibacillus rhizolycopersici]GIP48483.1 hypothetical protein J53TS2_20740 [Paenibacillus sp. J53TS2]
MFWKQLWESHKGRLLGIAAAVFLCPIYLFFGFWNMLFCALLLFIGYTIGKQKDLEGGPLFPWGMIWEWLSTRWRPFK